MNKVWLLDFLSSQGFSKKVLNTFEKVPREKFVPENLKLYAYDDIALPIGYEQTISQPYTIAVMLELLEPKKSQKVLEIGSGCGYVLALLSELVKDSGEVFGIEIIKELADKSKRNLKNHKNIKVFNKNGADGLKEFAPFNCILISAALEKIPDELVSQLSEGGILIAPVGEKHLQSLVKFQKIKNKLKKIKEIEGFVFVRFV